MNPPSGENDGLVALFSPRVSCIRREPSAPARKICVTISLRSGSMTASVCAHATRAPSGEGTTSPMVRVCIVSSGVHAAGACAIAMAAVRYRSVTFIRITAG